MPKVKLIIPQLCPHCHEPVTRSADKKYIHCVHCGGSWPLSRFQGEPAEAVELKAEQPLEDQEDLAEPEELQAPHDKED